MSGKKFGCWQEPWEVNEITRLGDFPVTNRQELLSCFVGNISNIFTGKDFDLHINWSKTTEVKCRPINFVCFTSMKCSTSEITIYFTQSYRSKILTRCLATKA